MRHTLLTSIICTLAILLQACVKDNPTDAPEQGKEGTEVIEQQGDDGQGEEEEEEGQDEGQGEGENEGEGQGEDEGGNPPVVEVLDPGQQPGTDKPTPSQPDAIHNLSTNLFFDNFQDYLDICGNIDYVLAQGFGTAWPALTEDGHLLLYQARGNKGGNYIRIRSANGAKLLKVTIHSATSSKVAYSLNGRPSTMSQTFDIAAGGTFTVGDGSELTGCTEVCFYCMGTEKSQRLEISGIFVQYQGGFVESDFYKAPVECGPFVRVALPYCQDFEDASFPTTEKNTYDKYGLNAGPENVQWNTWYGCFSWQHPKNVTTFGEKSAQLRVYKEDADYEKSQFGHLKTEFFVENLSQVSFDYYMSEFWMCATVSYCEFGSSEWTGNQQIALSQYSERETVRSFTYVLDEGRKHNAKIRIEIDPATGHPAKDHYDLLLDNFRFE